MLLRLQTLPRRPSVPGRALLCAALLPTLAACSTPPEPVTDLDGDGYDGIPAGGFDCNDLDASIHPGAEEICDGVDQDCDAEVDEGLLLTFYPDEDMDGFGDDTFVMQGCTVAASFTDRPGDCADGDPLRHPDADERCDLIDNDCNGTEDDDYAVDAPLWYADADGDGWGEVGQGASSCSRPPGFIEISGDCDDGNAAVHPEAPESDCADPTDYNCDGSTGLDDADGDGYPACGNGGPPDCDDADPLRNALAIESCNGLDDNCDGQTDEGFDNDGDGWLQCNGDCDDAAPEIHPGAFELPYDGIDSNCDGLDPDDLDFDGFVGEAAGGADCDDQDAAVHPGRAFDPLNGKDSDCDGEVDEGPFTVSHDDDLQPIWDVSCLAGCHRGANAAAELDLTLGQAYDAMRLVPSIDVPRMNMVEPGLPARSYLWHKLVSSHHSVGGTGAGMPTGAPLPTDQLNRIEIWILEGAPP